MERTKSIDGVFLNRNMCQTFYSNQGKIETNSNKSFKIKKALLIKKIPVQDSYPFYVYFGDIRVNSGKRSIKSKSKII